VATALVGGRDLPIKVNVPGLVKPKKEITLEE
jgi:hypothetical protein